MAERSDEMKEDALELLERVFLTLNDSLGDTDPIINEDSSDEYTRHVEPVVWCCRQIRKLIDDYEIVDGRELARWQNEIRALVIKESGAKSEDIDGSGCDSGDPLDLTLSEISQGFCHIEEKRPYWMWTAMLEYIYHNGGHCDGRFGPAKSCGDSGNCITEWCVPCDAAAFRREYRHKPDLVECSECGSLSERYAIDDDDSVWCPDCMEKWERKHGRKWEDGTPITEK